MPWVIRFRASISKMPTCEIQVIYFADSAVFLIFLPSISHEQYFESPLTITFSGRTQKDFSSSLEYFAQTVTNLLLSLAESTKNKPFLIF